MGFSAIDPSTPSGSDKMKFGDDKIREFKSQEITNWQQISNYNSNNSIPALRTAVWTTVARPTGGDLVDRVTGYNTDLGYEEYYDLASTSWKKKGLSVDEAYVIPTWNTAGRPSDKPTGYTGFNSELAVQERYNGSSWDRVSGDPRGKIDMWSGTVANIPSGWVLADGVEHTHPEGGSYTPPDLRNRFIVGAGNDSGTHTAGSDGVGSGYYAPGATGGQDLHTLTVSEMPSHGHGLYMGGQGGYTGATGGNNGSGTINDIVRPNGGGNSHENRPPYYALCYLYKL